MPLSSSDVPVRHPPPLC